MNKLKEFLYKNIYKMIRQYEKKKLTGNLGKVVEEDGKIVCYVKNGKLRKTDLTFFCGINKEQEKNAKAYKLNKPICYVIDGFKSEKCKFFFFGVNGCELVIKNCDFGLGLYIETDGKCTLDNTSITAFNNTLISADELIVENMRSDQIKVLASKLDIILEAKNKVDIVNSSIGTQEKSVNVKMAAKNELNIVNSNIIGKEIKCNANAINIDEKSSLIATNKTDLCINNFTTINIKTPIVAFNNKEVVNEKEDIILKKVSDPIAIKRSELINLLKTVRNECEKINSEKVSAFQDTLSNQSINKVLKK